ncbi:hypothetical protein DRO55_03180 [Candidatus Bathyarchaeota archaeon]|nr:MAG: hypothetical protein DRO55_03180 [Candidatus Bathyarchaeota archaeon]
MAPSFPKDWFPQYMNYPQICYYRHARRHLLLLTTDDDNYMIYSSIFKSFERYGFKLSAGIIVKPYVEGGPYPEMKPPYPSEVELKEMFLAGHSIVAHGYNHDRELWQGSWADKEEGYKAIAEQLTKARDGIFRITGHPIISTWLPWSLDHVNRGHGEVAREVGYVYCAQRQPRGEFHHWELDVPSRSTEVFQNTRDVWDVYDQVTKDIKARRLYTHLWGHGYLNTDNLEENLLKLSEDRDMMGFLWSTSVERAVRYIVERRYTRIEDWSVEDGLWTYRLSMELPKDLRGELYGRRIYNMPLTICHPNLEGGKPPYVYTEEGGELTRLRSWIRDGKLYYDVVPGDQRVIVSPEPLTEPSTPEVKLYIDELEVRRPCDGEPVRGGYAIQIIVEGVDPKAQIIEWKLTVIDGDGRYYTDHLGREIKDYKLPVNDWLDNRRGKIIYPIERGYRKDEPFTIICEVVNAHGVGASVRETI